MSVPPDPATAFRSELRTIGELLDRAHDPATREAAKRRIIALFHAVDAALGELSGIKEEIRGLVDRYKRVARGTPQQLHRDHLGASTFVERAWSLLVSGDPGGALTTLGRALELVPDDPTALSLKGWAETQLGRAETARATFEAVLAAEPDNALARMNLGYLHLRQGAFGDAIEQLSRAIRLGSDRKATLYAHYYLGLVYLERGMLADAEGLLATAVALGPNLIEAYHDLGRAQWLAGRREEATRSWSLGAAASPSGRWAERCRELLELASRGEEVLRFTSS